MSEVVLDASAILAIINAEPGAEKLTPDLLANAVCSTVNLAEVQATLVKRGWSADEAWEDATSPVRRVIPFSEQHARIAGSLVALAQSRGLSPGDRACIALGIALRAPIYTAQKSWSKLKMSERLHVIR